MFQNNLVANFANTRGFTEQSKTNAPSFGNNAYFNCINLTSLADGNTQAVSILIQMVELLRRIHLKMLIMATSH
ncbi:MAG: hypothetical protein SPE53_08500 [Prevotella sp.]|nr:hypothetical protein [Prevotella sp.]